MLSRARCPYVRSCASSECGGEPLQRFARRGPSGPRNRELVYLAVVAQLAHALQVAVLFVEAFPRQRRERLLLEELPLRFERLRIRGVDEAEHGLREVMLDVGVERAERRKNSSRRRNDHARQLELARDRRRKQAAVAAERDEA